MSNPETNPVSVDRRIRKTQAALKSALSQLMHDKRIKDISVKELTELADVNRGTFYLHYKDVFDLLEQSEKDLLTELHETIGRLDPDEVSKDPTCIFEGVYGLCQKNAGLVHILIGENGDIKFLNRLKELVREKCLTDWSFIVKDRGINHFDSYYSFVAGGCISLLQYWFSSGMNETPHELAVITGELLSGGLSMKTKM